MPHQLTLVIITIVATALVALIVILRNPKSEIAQSFAVLISFFVLWAALQGFIFISSSAEQTYVAELLTNYLGLGIAWSFLIFAYFFPYKSYRIERGQVVFLAGATILMFILMSIPGFIIDITQPWHHGLALPANKINFALYILLFSLIFGNAYQILIKKFLVSTAENKILLLHVIYSSAVPVIAGSILNLLLIEFDEFRYQIYGPSFTLFFTLTVAYLIFIRRER